MDFLIISIILLIIVITLKILFGYNLKKIKEMAVNVELDKIGDKYPENIDMC